MNKLILLALVVIIALLSILAYPQVKLYMLAQELEEQTKQRILREIKRDLLREKKAEELAKEADKLKKQMKDCALLYPAKTVEPYTGEQLSKLRDSLIEEANNSGVEISDYYIKVHLLQHKIGYSRKEGYIKYNNCNVSNLKYRDRNLYNTEFEKLN